MVDVKLNQYLELHIHIPHLSLTTSARCLGVANSVEVVQLVLQVHGALAQGRNELKFQVVMFKTNHDFNSIKCRAKKS